MSNEEIRELTDKLNALRSSENASEIVEDIVDTLNNISNAYCHVNPDKAEEYAKEAMEIASENEYTAGVARSYRVLGISCWSRGDFYGALEQFNRCLKVYRVIYDISGLIGTNLNIGLMHTELGDYSKAFEYYFQCVEMCEGDPDYEAILATAFLNIGVAYERMGDTGKALEYYFNGLDLYIKHGNTLSIGRSYANIASVYLAKGEMDKSLEYASKSLAIAEEEDASSEKAHAYLLLGLVFEKKSDYEKSLEFFLKSKDIVEKLGEKHNVIYAYYGLSNVYKELGEYEKAFEYIEKGVGLSRDIGAKHTEIEGYKSLAEFYENNSDLESSLECYKKYWELKEEVIGDEAADKIAHLQVMHEVEKKEKEAEIHRLKNEELVIEIEERKKAEKALKESEEKFRKLSIEDPLTGVFNRRYFFDQAERFITRANADGNNLCLAIIDIDHFKRINDTYGHMAGDYVLKELAGTIIEYIRPSDILARYGGEEFSLLLTDVSCENTLNTMERIREAIGGHGFVFGEETIGITISAGIAALDEAGDGGKKIDELLKQADERLYEAKESGRNKVVGYE